MDVHGQYAVVLYTYEKNGELDSLERHENGVEDSNEDESVTIIQNDDV
jgi:hypothetical protein